MARYDINPNESVASHRAWLLFSTMCVLFDSWAEWLIYGHIDIEFMLISFAVCDVGDVGDGTSFSTEIHNALSFIYDDKNEPILLQTKLTSFCSW